jgi:curved DNA-binding protein CbpA
VATAASADEIRAAYRRRARELHPDAHPDDGANADDAEMAAVNEAWRVLSDVGRRREYDVSIGIPAPQPGVTPSAAAAPSSPAQAFDDDEDDASDALDLLDLPVGPMEARGTRHVALMLGATLVVMGVFVVGMFVYAFFRSGTLFP